MVALPANVESRGRTCFAGRQEYFPYGKASDRRDERNRYRYIGVERDEATGLMMTGPRAYAICTGRFLSPEPITNEAIAFGTFVYSRSAPLRYSDSSGWASQEQNAALQRKIDKVRQPSTPKPQSEAESAVDQPGAAGTAAAGVQVGSASVSRLGYKALSTEAGTAAQAGVAAQYATLGDAGTKLDYISEFEPHIEYRASLRTSGRVNISTGAVIMSEAVDGNSGKSGSDFYDEKLAKLTKGGAKATAFDVADEVAQGVGRTQSGVTRGAIVGTVAGPAMAGVGIAFAADNVRRADDPVAQAAEEMLAYGVGGVGAQLGGALGAGVGTFVAGPAGAGPGYFVGTVAGGVAGDLVLREALDEAALVNEQRASVGFSPLGEQMYAFGKM